MHNSKSQPWAFSIALGQLESDPASSASFQSVSWLPYPQNPALGPQPQISRPGMLTPPRDDWKRGLPREGSFKSPTSGHAASMTPNPISMISDSFPSTGLHHILPGVLIQLVLGQTWSIFLPNLSPNVKWREGQAKSWVLQCPYMNNLMMCSHVQTLPYIYTHTQIQMTLLTQWTRVRANSER